MLQYLKWRTYRRAYFRLLYTQVSPESLARGVALGLFIGLLIPMGLQIAIVLPLALAFKAAKVPAIAFTFVTNHVTVFFIYPIQCWIGSYLMLSPLRYAELAAQLRGLIAADSFSGMMKEIGTLGMQIAVSFFLGGLLFGIIAGVIGYIFTKRAAVRFRARLEERRRRRRRRAAERSAGPETLKK